MIKKYLVEKRHDDKYPEKEFNLRLKFLQHNSVWYFNVPFDEITSFVSHLINTWFLQAGTNMYLLQYVNKDKSYVRCISNGVSLEYNLIDHLEKYPFEFKLHEDVIEHYNKGGNK